MLTFNLMESGPDPLIMLLFALLADGLLPDLPSVFRLVPHPVVIIGRIISELDRALNKDSVAAVKRLLLGAGVAIYVAGLAAAVGALLAGFGRQYAIARLAEFLLVIALLAQRSLYDHVRAVMRGLGRKGLEGGREAVARIVGRDPQTLDEYGVARAAIESCAENFSDGVVAPVFWYVVAGLPGLLAYKAVNTMDSMIGHRSPRYLAFGKAAARLDDAMNWIPARLAGLFVVVGAMLAPRAKSGKALRTMMRDASRHRSPNSGWPEAAMAGALGLALGGPRRYAELVVNDPWLGDGRARATIDDIRNCLTIYKLACFANAGAVGMVVFALR